jgi:hypothetical protein
MAVQKKFSTAGGGVLMFLWAVLPVYANQYVALRVQKMIVMVLKLKTNADSFTND